MISKNVLMRNMICIPFVLVFALPGIVFAEDSVTVRADDARRRHFTGTIIEETYEYVRMEYQGEERREPMVQDGERHIVEVQRRRFPSVFAGANNERRNGHFEEAFNLYRESVEAGEVHDNPWLAPYLRYYAGDVAYMEADQNSWEPERKKEWFSRAVTRFEMLLEEQPRHRLAPDAALAMARALTKMGELERARETLETIADSDYPFWIKQEAGVWEGRLLAEEGRYGEAIDKMSELWEEYRDENPELADKARFSQGLALEGEGRPEQAESIFQEIGFQGHESEMQAVAWNRRGLSLLARGQQREALMSFLRVVIMHPEIHNETQMALYYAARASEGYYGDDDRARELRDKLTLRFRDSYWAGRLEE